MKQTRVRESNIELLRIVSMFMVLLVHSNFFSLGEPTSIDIIQNPVDATARVVFETASIACVDIFILISGWFGIRPKMKSLCSFIFQSFFFLTGSYFIPVLLGRATLSSDGIVGCFAGTHFNWFIKAYLFLYVLSPILNYFVDYAPRSLFRNTLIGFYVLQSIYGWILPSATTYIELGYSPLSFIGLYLLARYIRVYTPSYTRQNLISDGVVILVVICCVSMAYIVPPYLFNICSAQFVSNRFINYIAPTTILIAIFTLLMFSKMKIKSKFINWVAASCFAVFLLHTSPSCPKIRR